jgi:DNA topoisomerase-1
MDPQGHLQATGRDARGRKQYRYHPRWNQIRNESKYDRMLTFALALPRIRRRVAADLRRSGLSRDKILATVVRLLEATLIRIGNEEYARTNESFGLTTLRDRHVKVKGSTLRFEFRGWDLDSPTGAWLASSNRVRTSQGTNYFSTSMRRGDGVASRPAT